MTADASALPVDQRAVDALAASGLRYGLLDTSDRKAFEAWFAADARGFAESRTSESVMASNVEHLAVNRTTGVWDDSIPNAEVPVATVNSWVTELTVPGPVVAPAWAVSSVTVAPTHRRRGVARAMMEAELRVAHAAGVPMAILTASEATLYSRYGYAPATSAASVEVDRRRVSWAAPVPSGRVHFVEAVDLLTDAVAISERAVRRSPGEVARWTGFFPRYLALDKPGSDVARALRTVRYDDADGVAQGWAAYHVDEKGPETRILMVDVFEAATDDASRGLWRFLLEHDFVTSIHADLRSIDEPLKWLVDDARGVRWTHVSDHLWVRILDTATALEARRYETPGALELVVDDPLEFANGRFLLEVAAGGRASVTAQNDEYESTAPVLRLSVNDLGAIYLGGYRPSMLAAAGRIEADDAAIRLADRLFAAERTPHLSIWF